MATKKTDKETNEVKIENHAPEKDLEAENAALKAELETLKANAVKPETETPKKTGPNMVKIRIPRTKVDEEDVFVSVNMRTYIVKRGVEVEVPDFVAEVLRHQEEMLEEIMIFQNAVQNKNK